MWAIRIYIAGRPTVMDGVYVGWYVHRMKKTGWDYIMITAAVIDTRPKSTM
jgi:hypothetical protein